MKKSLIIYFSHVGENYMSDGIRPIQKGNTEVIAEMIEEITQAKMFKVEPIQDYPFSYKECTEIALYEKNTKARPTLKNDLTSVSDYDVIYIGYPNWWGTMPMALFTLLEKLDLSNKVIKPFCTHEGSAMGTSGEDLKKVCKNSIIKKGLPIRGSLVYKAKSEVENWILAE
ncbi:MAG: NAD(P)H-dependent oxidoreductase [Anaeroplasmataceae bacterium]|nr:NAD(P)H-dependent oxidoreductase [Anaeroplasmataceae bacterium]